MKELVIDSFAGSKPPALARWSNPVTRPLLLDLFCGAGGCAVGYHRAGFDVVGVDHKPQPRYPFEFVQGDALEAVDLLFNQNGNLWTNQDRWFLLDNFAAIHASPPCQRYSRLFTTMEHRRDEHPDLVDKTRELLKKTGLPWVIENVEGAPLCPFSVVLCGAMFGLRTYRHRLFESSRPFPYIQHPKHKVKSDKGSRRKEYFEAGGFISVVGNVGSYCGPAAMGIDWMTGEELSQAIPPAYTEWIGKQLIRHCGVTP
jgi:DNA (cytosine-5)-methyltransferase 1